MLIALVTEALIDRPLAELFGFLSESVPEATALEIGAGGYAPHPQCDRAG